MANSGRKFRRHSLSRFQMRTLQFDPLSRQFDIVYSSLLQSPLPLRGATERRTQIGLLISLVTIGQLKPTRDTLGNPREPTRDELHLYETVSGGSIAVNEAEFDLLKKHVTATVDSDGFPKAWSRE